jgi:hypothetical protein
MKKEHSKSGFALAVAVFALVVVGVLVTGGFYLARQETRIGVASQRATAAFYVAEQGAMEVMSEWDPATFSALSDWSTATAADSTDNGTWSVNVTKMSSRLYFLLSTGTVSEGSGVYGDASRMVGMIARVNTADITPPAALTTQGILKYGGTSEVRGIDEIPDGRSGGVADWTGLCDPDDLGDKPGILINDTLNIVWTGDRPGIEENMTGTPTFDEDPTITAESLMTFGDMDWDAMVALANIRLTVDPKTVGPSVVAGECDTTDKSNWGAPTDPTSVCFNHFPIIYYPGSGELLLSKGIGQGILLIEGDLKVSGGFEFYGPVFVKGTMTTAGSGGHFWGGVVAANADISENTVLGNAVITFSSCAVNRAILNNPSLTRVRPVEDRSWVDLSSVISG